MNSHQIAGITNEMRERGVEDVINGSSFEDLTETLKTLLGDEYYVYEGSNHIAVHKRGRGERDLFIKRKFEP